MIQKRKLINLIIVVLLCVFLIIFLINIANIINNNTDTFIVEEGTLSYEEEAEGYIIRDETVLEGSGNSSGISQIVADGTRASKGEAVFRYYSSDEEEINSQIEEIDNQIDEALSNSQSRNYFN